MDGEKPVSNGGVLNIQKKSRPFQLLETDSFFL
jgi:hypothetical protein